MARVKRKNFISSLWLVLITLIFISGCTNGDENMPEGQVSSSDWITVTDATTFSVLSPVGWQTAVGRGALLEGFITQDYLDQLWETKSTLLFVAFDSVWRQNRSQKPVLRKYLPNTIFRGIINIINIVGIEYKELGMVLDDVNKLHTPCRGISIKYWNHDLASSSIGIEVKTYLITQFRENIFQNHDFGLSLAS